MRASLRKPLIRGLQGLAMLAWLHLVCVNLLINSDWLLGKINRRPERLRLGWSSAWCLWPGRVHVTDFRLHGRDSKLRFAIGADEVRATVDLLALLSHEFHASSVRGSGLTVDVQKRKKKPAPAPAGSVPPVPEVTEPAASATATPEAPAPTAIPTAAPSASGPAPEAPRSSRGPWQVRLEDVKLDPARTLSFGPHRFEGAARVEGSLLLRPRQQVQIGPTTVEVRSGTWRLGTHQVASALSGVVACSLESVKPGEDKGLELLRYLHADTDLQAEVEDVRFLEFYLKRVPWLKLGGQGGTMLARAKVGRGAFLPGTLLEIRSREVLASVPDYQVRGAGDLRFAVTESPAGPQAELVAEFRDYGMQRDGYGLPHIRGTGLRIEARSPDVSVFEPFDEVEASMVLPAAEVPDLRFYNAYLPRGLGLGIEAGTGQIQSRFSASAHTQTASGEIQLLGRGIQARLDDFRISGRWDLTTRLNSADLLQRSFDVTGSSLHLEDVSVVDEDAKTKDSTGWWGHVWLERARLTPGRPELLEADIRMELRDVRPLFKLYAAKESLPGWVQKIFGEKRLKASGLVRVGQEVVDVERLQIKAKNIEIRARLRIRGKRKLGILYASYGLLSVGIELKDDKTKLKVFRPGNWFDKYPPFEPL